MRNLCGEINWHSAIAKLVLSPSKDRQFFNPQSEILPAVLFCGLVRRRRNRVSSIEHRVSSIKYRVSSIKYRVSNAFVSCLPQQAVGRGCLRGINSLCPLPSGIPEGFRGLSPGNSSNSTGCPLWLKNKTSVAIKSVKIRVNPWLLLCLFAGLTAAGVIEYRASSIEYQVSSIEYQSGQYLSIGRKIVCRGSRRLMYLTPVRVGFC